VAQAQEQVEYPAKPSPEHAVLKADVGVWDTEITMMGPEGEMKSKGVETVTMLGELWNVSTITYDFMGQPTTGHGIIGFDPEKKKYVGTWYEAGNPYASNMIGTYDEKSKTMTYEMESKDPSGNISQLRIKAQQIDDKNRTFEMLMKMPDSDEYSPMMNMKYTKRDE